MRLLNKIERNFIVNIPGMASMDYSVKSTGEGAVVEWRDWVDGCTNLILRHS